MQDPERVKGPDRFSGGCWDRLAQGPLQCGRSTPEHALRRSQGPKALRPAPGSSFGSDRPRAPTPRRLSSRPVQVRNSLLPSSPTQARWFNSKQRASTEPKSGRCLSMDNSTSRPASQPLQRLSVLAWGWAVLGATIALPQISRSTPDSRLLVASASIILPASAVAAGFALRHRRIWLACLLLALSVATPTYFAFVFNLIPVGIIIAALIDGRRHPRGPQRLAGGCPEPRGSSWRPQMVRRLLLHHRIWVRQSRGRELQGRLAGRAGGGSR